MRISIWIGLLTLAIGIFLSYLADAMIQTQTTGTMQTTAAIIASVMYILISASMLGTGAGLVLHWLFGFAKHWKAYIAEIIFAMIIFIVGLIVTAFSGNWWTALQAFFTFLTASTALFLLSFITMFGGIIQGILKVKKYVKKRLKR